MLALTKNDLCRFLFLIVFAVISHYDDLSESTVSRIPLKLSRCVMIPVFDITVNVN